MPKIHLALAALLLAAPAAVAAETVPTLNTAHTCKGASLDGLSTRNARLQNAERQSDYDRCMTSENAARSTLARDWQSFPAADRSQCTRTAQMGVSESYVQLLTCLELERDARNLPKDSMRNPVTGPTR